MLHFLLGLFIPTHIGLISRIKLSPLISLEGFKTLFKTKIKTLLCDFILEAESDLGLAQP